MPETVDAISRKVRGVVLEGLFVKGAPQTPELVADLKRCGFDGSKIQPEYTALVFNACLDVTRKHVHGQLPIADGFQRLGVAQVNGIRDTLIGAVLLPALKLISAERVVKRIPTLFKVDSTPAQITVREVDQRRWRVEFRGDPTMVPDYIGGICKALVELTHVEAVAVARPLGVGDFDIELTWR